MSDGFELQNDPPEHPKVMFDENDKTRQRVLFSGMDCLPGQMDLFPTDGQEDD